MYSSVKKAEFADAPIVMEKTLDYKPDTTGKSKVNTEAIDIQLGIGRVRRPVK